MDRIGFEEDLPPATASDVACYAQSVAAQLSEISRQFGLSGLAALFVAADREAGRALKRLGPAGRPEAIKDWGEGPRDRTQAAHLCAELAIALVLECERVGLASVATLFYAAWQAAGQDELA